MKNDCLFCAIAAGEIPSVKIYEDDAVLAFLDISPVEKGHTLVVSKRSHNANLIEAPDDVVAELLAAARKIGAAMVEAGFGGFNVVQNNFEAAGQTVMHLHFHVIPRIAGTAPVAWSNGANPYRDDAERDEYAAKIRACIR